MFSFYFALAALANAGAPLDLPTAQDLALREQPYLESRRLAQVSAEEAAVAASALPDPRLKLSITNVPVDTWSLDEDPMTQRMLSVEQMLPGGAKRALRGEAAERESARAAAEFALARLEIRRAVARAWLDAYRWSQAVALIAEQEEILRRQVDAAAIAYRAGKIGQEALFAARVSLGRLGEQAAAAAAQLRTARAELARWLGRDGDRELAGLPDTPAPPVLSDLDGQLPRHPQVQAIDAALAQSRAEAKLAREARKPDWTVEVGYGWRNPVFGDMVSAQVGVDLPIFPKNRQDRVAAARHAQAERLEKERDDALRAIGAELARTHAEWAAAGARLALIDAQTLPDARSRVDAALAGYRAGTVPLSTLFDAQVMALEVRLERLAQETARARARTELAFFEGEAL